MPGDLPEEETPRDAPDAKPAATGRPVARTRGLRPATETPVKPVTALETPVATVAAAPAQESAPRKAGPQPRSAARTTGNGAAATSTSTGNGAGNGAGHGAGAPPAPSAPTTTSTAPAPAPAGTEAGTGRPAANRGTNRTGAGRTGSTGRTTGRRTGLTPASTTPASASPPAAEALVEPAAAKVSWFEPPDDGPPTLASAEPVVDERPARGAMVDWAASPTLLAPRPVEPAVIPVPEPAPVLPASAPEPTGLVTTAVPAVTQPRPLTRRQRRVSRRPRTRRVDRIIRHVDAWSVMKVSFIFYLVVVLVLLTAGVLLWALAISTGTIDNVENFIKELFALDSFTFKGSEIFRASVLIGGVLVLAGTFTNVLLCVLFNLISDLVGGIRLTVIEEEPIRVRPPRPPAARQRRQPDPVDDQPPKPTNV